MRGVLSRLMEVLPRILITEAAPTVPELCRTVTPGARPWSSAVRSAGAAFASSSGACSVTAALPSSRRRCSPVTVTTSSSSPTAETWRRKSAATVCPACTCTVWFTVAYPSLTTRSSTLPAGTPARA